MYVTLRSVPKPSNEEGSTNVLRQRRIPAAVFAFGVVSLPIDVSSLLAETRSVDDQVEWLDDDRLLYGLCRPGSEATTSDVWVVPADGSGTAAVLIPEASSPAVIR
jgi:hypothetical protein